MNYAKEKRMMNTFIDNILSNSKEIEKTQLYYLIDNKFGFGKLAVDRRLKILEEIGALEIQENKIIKL